MSDWVQDIIDEQSVRIEALEAENARLRAALRDFLSVVTLNYRTHQGPAENAARAALGEDTDKPFVVKPIESSPVMRRAALGEEA